MTKTLNTIQVLSKIGKIFSRIIFILSVIGAAMCLVGIIDLAVGLEILFKFGSVTVRSFLANNVGLSLHEMYAAMISGLIVCAGEAVLSKFAEVYFKHELSAGTPFTFAGAKEMLTLGILAIAIPLGTSVISAVCYAIANAVSGGLMKSELDMSFSCSFGIMFIIMSVIFKYGAELSFRKNDEIIIEGGKEYEQ